MPPEIHGTKYDDTDGSGDLTSGDVVLSGVTITLTGTDGMGGSVTLTTTTDVDGDYWFTGLKPGSYTVTETVPGGTVATSATAIGVDLSSGDNEQDVDFFNFELFDISGTKFNDINGDGLTVGDPGLAGVTIFIDNDSSGDLSAGDETTVTAGDGTWSFTNLDFTYAGLDVFEVIPDGQVQTLGEFGYEIEGTSGTDQTGLDFANHVPQDPLAQSPGFWKNHLNIFDQELEELLGENPAPRTLDYEDVFGVFLEDTGVPKFYPNDPNLMQSLKAKGGGEGALLRATTTALANGASDDLSYSYGTLLPGDVDLALLDAIDLNDDTFISTDELFSAVQDLYEGYGANGGSTGTGDFDFGGVNGLYDVGDLADALDEMNNLPHLDTNDFMP